MIDPAYTKVGFSMKNLLSRDLYAVCRSSGTAVFPDLGLFVYFGGIPGAVIPSSFVTSIRGFFCDILKNLISAKIK